MTPLRASRSPRARAEHGFTMIIAIGVMFVTSLMLVAAFTIANGEVSTTRSDATRKQAYYAALAGIQQYEYKLQANPSYWTTCEAPKSSVPEETGTKYEVTPLPASTAPVGTTSCSTSAPFASMIESKGTLVNTFRVKSVGTAGKAQRTLVATFKVTGFLDFIYYTNFETEDPALYNAPAACVEKYHSEWVAEGAKCATITFTSGDSVEGPMHTNDAAKVEGSASFGREGQSPPDEVQINEGTYPEDEKEKCSGGKPTFNTATGCYTKGPTLKPPAENTSIAFYAEAANKFQGQTRLVLNGSTNKITVTKYTKVGAEYVESKETVGWPKNGLIWVEEGAGCATEFEPKKADTATEEKGRRGCGDVYISGTYSKSLTVASVTNVIINGNLYPTSVEGKVGAAPPSTSVAVLGLIAQNYVRIYHPCVSKNEAGSLENPWIYAAMLAVQHSFLVDNYDCGAKLGELHIWGAIAQNYRGIVGTVGATGYIKDYKYDDRLATDEPPYFLAPLKSGWKIIRQTAIGAG